MDRGQALSGLTASELDCMPAPRMVLLQRARSVKDVLKLNIPRFDLQTRLSMYSFLLFPP